MKAIILLTLLLLPTAIAAESPRGAETFAAGSINVTLRWDSHGGDGFRVYVRRQGRTYVGYMSTTNTSILLTGLMRKTTYKCVVTATSGDYETPPSPELTFRTGNNSGDVEEL